MGERSLGHLSPDPMLEHGAGHYVKLLLMEFSAQPGLQKLDFNQYVDLPGSTQP